jgi:hypothetical protein
MLIRISGIQIFTEIEISIFEKVVHFLKNRIKKWEHLNFLVWGNMSVKRPKKLKKIKTSTHRLT